VTEPEKTEPDALEVLITEKAVEGKDSGWAVASVLLQSLKVQKQSLKAQEGIGRQLDVIRWVLGENTTFAGDPRSTEAPTSDPWYPGRPYKSPQLTEQLARIANQLDECLQVFRVSDFRALKR
jgi:hypothetical protein